MGMGWKGLRRDWHAHSLAPPTPLLKPLSPTSLAHAHKQWLLGTLLQVLNKVQKGEEEKVIKSSSAFLPSFIEKNQDAFWAHCPETK